MKRLITLLVVIGMLISGGCMSIPPLQTNWRVFVEKKMQTTRQWKIRDTSNSIGELKRK